MELGGLAPLIVHEDANVDLAVDQTIATNSVTQDKLVFARIEFMFTNQLNKSILKS